MLLVGGLRGLVDLGDAGAWMAAGGIVLLFGVLIGGMAADRMFGRRE